MAVSINATPYKVYVMLFMIIFIAYGTFIIVKVFNRKNVDYEHFKVSEEDSTYQYRMEVIKIFDMYLHRNPTPEEIDKYSELKNEQEILLAVLRDFNVDTTSDVDPRHIHIVAEETLIETQTKDISPMENYVEEESPSQEISSGFDFLKKQVLKKTISKDVIPVSKVKYEEFRQKLEELILLYTKFIPDE
jgi:hypothetical protein